MSGDRRRGPGFDSTVTGAGRAAPGTRRPIEPVIGRFEIEEKLGEGAMGVVYAARDRALNRRVAIKVVHPARADSPDSRVRMLREAQALARLSHPNVVAIFEADVWRDQVYVAMELVEGATLADLISAHSVAPLDALAILHKAGAGLAAAHAAEIVHRDFKPANVLVRDDGEVKVCDFGLAWVDAAGANAEEGAVGTVSQTATGALVGTPRYMAPEQYLGAAVDARADQFAFCLVACELLYGHQPFFGANRAELAASVTSGSPATPGDETLLPDPVWAVLRRGMSRDPAARFDSVSALLAALDEAFEPLRRPELAYRRAFESRWNDQARAAVRSAFVATGRMHAEASWARVCELLDRYVASWLDADEPAAHAALQQGVAAELAELDAAVQLLTGPCDGAVVDRAVEVVFALPSPRSWRASPIGREAADAYRSLAAGRMFQHVGRSAAASEHLHAAIAAADAIGADSIAAEAHLMLAHLAMDQGGFDAGEVELRAALAAAARGHDDALLAKAWGHLAFLEAARSRDSERAATLREVAEVAALRTDDELARAWVYNDLGAAHLFAERLAEASELLRASCELKEKLLGRDHPDVAVTCANLGVTLARMGRLEEGRELLRRTVDIEQLSLGPSHYLVAFSLEELAEAHLLLGEVSEARDAASQAYEARVQSFGAGDPQAARVLLVLTESCLAMGDSAGARRACDELFGLVDDAPDPFPRARAHFARARVYGGEDPEEAVAHAERALAALGEAGDPQLRDAIESWLADRG